MSLCTLLPNVCPPPTNYRNILLGAHVVSLLRTHFWWSSKYHPKTVGEHAVRTQETQRAHL